MEAKIRDAIRTLHTYFVENHDVVDVGGGDRPGQGPNWAMDCSRLLEEIEQAIKGSETTPLLIDNDWLQRKLASGVDDSECEARPALSRVEQTGKRDE